MTLTSTQKCLKNINILIFALVLGLAVGYLVSSAKNTEYASIKIHKHDHTYEYKFDFYNKLLAQMIKRITKVLFKHFMIFQIKT